MDLKSYLVSRKITNGEFAKMVGVSKVSISNYICGRRTPTLAIAIKIRAASNGRVLLKDLLKHYEIRESHERNYYREHAMRTANMAEDD